MLLISVAFAFQASGAVNDESHAEARFLSGSLGGSSGTLDSVADLAGVKADNLGAAAADTQTNPLDLTVLSAIPVDIPGGVTIPIGGAGGLIDLGAVNQYAQAADAGASRAASGAVNDSGAVDTTGGGAFPANATLNLGTGPLAGLTALADVKLSAGAITGVAALDAAQGQALDITCGDLSNPDQCRDYNIADVTAELDVPALATLSTTIDTQIGTALGDLNAISLTDICPAPAGDPALTAICAALPGLVDVAITGPSLNDLTAGLTNVSQNGVTLNVDAGTISLDLDAIVLAATGLAINDQPPGTDLIPILTAAIANNVDDLVAGVIIQIVDQITSDSSITLTLPGVPLVLNATQLDALLGPITDALNTALTSAAGLLSDALGTITDEDTGLGALLQITLNEQEEPSAGVFRETALRVNLLGGQAAVVDLGMAQVGPNGIGSAANDAVANADTNADTNADVSDADVNGDGQSDSDVTDPLPATGAPNMLPLIFLAIALIALGTGIVVNEKRRPVTD